jgi:hypothetical protein
VSLGSFSTPPVALILKLPPPAQEQRGALVLHPDRRQARIGAVVIPLTPLHYRKYCLNERETDAQE